MHSLPALASSGSIAFSTDTFVWTFGRMVSVFFSEFVTKFAVSLRLLMVVASTTFDHISAVVSVGSKQKMFGVDARGVITRMTNHHSWWNPLIVSRFPSQSMSQVLVAIDVEDAVSVALEDASPFDTYLHRTTISEPGGQ